LTSIKSLAINDADNVEIRIDRGNRTSIAIILVGYVTGHVTAPSQKPSALSSEGVSSADCRFEGHDRKNGGPSGTSFGTGCAQLHKAAQEFSVAESSG
jgi:hypothetical protein